MNLRALRYFAALARLGHFARAAEQCGVTQPTLSAALAGLEVEVGKRLIERERRFIGLTAEGEAMLPWVQQMLATHDAMLQSVELVSGPLTGEMHIGAIPAALPLTGTIGSLLLEAHPRLSISVRSLTSAEIAQGLHAFEIDAGITYLDEPPSADVIAEPLTTDRHYFLAAKEARSLPRDEIGWTEAAGHPLCLLHEGMKNRRIIDTAFAHHGLSVSPRATADSFITLLAMVRTGQFATIIPESHRFLVDGLDWADLLPLERLPGGQEIGLVILDRAPLGALPAAALAMARRFGDRDRR